MKVYSKKRVSDAGEDADGAGQPAALTPEQVWSRLLGWQTRREHSHAELVTKLRQFGADSQQIDDAMARLTDLDLQNDDRFAEVLVRTQLQRGRGERVIRQHMKQRGITPDHQELADQTIDTDWVARARALLHRRFGEQPATEQRERARQVRFLQYRGFSLSQALAAMGRADDDPESDLTDV